MATDAHLGSDYEPILNELERNRIIAVIQRPVGRTSGTYMLNKYGPTEAFHDDVARVKAVLDDMKKAKNLNDTTPVVVEDTIVEQELPVDVVESESPEVIVSSIVESIQEEAATTEEFAVIVSDDMVIPEMEDDYLDELKIPIPIAPIVDVASIVKEIRDGVTSTMQEIRKSASEAAMKALGEAFQNAGEVIVNYGPLEIERNEYRDELIIMRHKVSSLQHQVSTLKEERDLYEDEALHLQDKVSSTKTFVESSLIPLLEVIHPNLGYKYDSLMQAALQTAGVRHGQIQEVTAEAKNILADILNIKAKK